MLNSKLKSLLDFQQTCSLLNIKESRLRLAIHRKEIPYIKIGKLLRFDLDQLKEWISKNSSEVIDETK